MLFAYKLFWQQIKKFYQQIKLWPPMSSDWKVMLTKYNHNFKFIRFLQGGDFHLNYITLKV